MCKVKAKFLFSSLLFDLSIALNTHFISLEKRPFSSALSPAFERVQFQGVPLSLTAQRQEAHELE